MADKKGKHKPAARRHAKGSGSRGKKVVWHVLRGSACLMLPPETHTLLNRTRLERLRTELQQQDLWLNLNLGRRWVTVKLPMLLMVWPPETAEQSAKGTKQSREGSA